MRWQDKDITCLPVRKKRGLPQKGFIMMFLTEEEISRIMTEAPLHIRLIVIADRLEKLWVRLISKMFSKETALKMWDKEQKRTRNIRRKMDNALIDWMNSVFFWGPIE